MFFYDILNIILNIWLWIRTFSQLKFIIPCLSFYSEFIAFVLLSYIFPGVINRQVLKSNTFVWTFKSKSNFLKSNLCGKLRTNLYDLIGSTVFYIHEYNFHSMVSQVPSPFIKVTRAWWLLCLFLPLFFIFIVSGPYH